MSYIVSKERLNTLLEEQSLKLDELDKESLQLFDEGARANSPKVLKIESKMEDVKGMI